MCGTGQCSDSELLIVDVCPFPAASEERQKHCPHPILTERVGYVSGHVLADGASVYHHCSAGSP